MNKWMMVEEHERHLQTNNSIGVNVYVSIGALGSMKIEKGLYAYVGSVQRNLEKRVARHISRGGKKNLAYRLFAQQQTCRGFIDIV